MKRPWRTSLLTLTVMLVITLVGSWLVRREVHNQESQLLGERTSEVRLVLTTSISSLPGPLDVLGGVLRATGSSRAAFMKASAATVAGDSGKLTLALVKRTPAGFAVAVADGRGLTDGEVITDERAEAFQRALTTSGELVPTTVLGTGANRILGFAVGPPIAPAGTVLYRQSRLGPLSAPRAAKTAPFSELNVVIYASSPPMPAEVLASTSRTLPLRGLVRSQPLPVGPVTWTLVVSAVHPLVGTDAADAPWIVLIGGIVLALLVASVIEAETRRRESAVALYDSEHHVAEMLQRSLLPNLPAIPSLDLAARYLPGATDQRVGGDWFDVFTLEDGRVGVVIGDVVGHDIVAAAAMSQIQAALRAYAWQGEEPAALLDRLDEHIAAFQISDLVTLFYGVLGVPGRDGTRTLRYANAGHLHPLIRRSDGETHEVNGASSVLLGAPVPPGTARGQGEAVLDGGSTLLLFTDGLVEAPGELLSDSLAQLQAAVATAAATTADALCELAIRQMKPGPRRDDVAVLAIRLAPPRTRSARADASKVTGADHA